MNEIAPAALARFRRDLAALLPEDQGGRPLALAVSGGPDSMALLALAVQTHAVSVIAATVDHGLRPEAAAEGAMVAQVCAGLGVAHAILPITAPTPATGNRHAWARRQRYRRLADWAAAHDAAALCTAHHADDQAETFLMRAMRGAGLGGLAGVRARVADMAGLTGRSSLEGPAIPLLRPVLQWRRAELRAVVKGAALPFVTDPSNADPRFERARMRTWLGKAPWFDAVQVARSAAYLAEVEADLGEMADWAWTSRALPAPEGEVMLDVAGLPRGLRRVLALRSISRVRGYTRAETDRIGSIEPLLDALDAGKGATHADVQAHARGTLWHFRPAPPRRGG